MECGRNTLCLYSVAESNTRGVALGKELIALSERYRIVADNHFIDYKVGGSQIIIALFVF